jgi:hypothetical protein
MNKFIIALSLFFISSFATAQKVMVTKQNEKAKTETVEVSITTLEGKKEDVLSAWMKFLKDIGKARQGADLITVTDPVLNGTAFTKKSFYANAKGDEKTTTIWAGIIASEWESTEVNYVNRELDKLVYQFGIKYYKDKVQAQIDETQQALEAVERQQQRLVNQNGDLNGKLVSNEKEKIQLEKSLEANKLEHAVLLVKIENNKKAQDSIANANAQIKKVMELHKDKYRKIN